MSELSRPHLAAFQLDLLARHIGTATRKAQRQLEKQIGKSSCAELFGVLFAQCDHVTSNLASTAADLTKESAPEAWPPYEEAHAETVEAHVDTDTSSDASQVPQERIAALADDRLDCIRPILMQILNAHLNGHPLEPLLDEVLRRNVAAHPCCDTADSMVSELSSKQLKREQRRSKRVANRGAAASSQQCDGAVRAKALGKQGHCLQSSGEKEHHDSVDAKTGQDWEAAMADLEQRLNVQLDEIRSRIEAPREATPADTLNVRFKETLELLTASQCWLAPGTWRPLNPAAPIFQPQLPTHGGEEEKVPTDGFEQFFGLVSCDTAAKADMPVNQWADAITINDVARGAWEKCDEHDCQSKSSISYHFMGEKIAATQTEHVFTCEASAQTTAANVACATASYESAREKGEAGDDRKLHAEEACDKGAKLTEQDHFLLQGFEHAPASGVTDGDLEVLDGSRSDIDEFLVPNAPDKEISTVSFNHRNGALEHMQALSPTWKKLLNCSMFGSSLELLNETFDLRTLMRHLSVQDAALRRQALEATAHEYRRVAKNTDSAAVLLRTLVVLSLPTPEAMPQDLLRLLVEDITQVATQDEMAKNAMKRCRNLLRNVLPGNRLVCNEMLDALFFEEKRRRKRR